MKNPPTHAGGKNERKKMKGEITYAISTNTYEHSDGGSGGARTRNLCRDRAAL